MISDIKYLKELIKHLMSYTDSDTNELKLMDFGCGPGYLSMAAAELGFKKVYAVDINTS
jgi:ribosomal protein L11 methylase PrmA